MMNSTSIDIALPTHIPYDLGSVFITHANAKKLMQIDAPNIDLSEYYDIYVSEFATIMTREELDLLAFFKAFVTQNEILIRVLSRLPENQYQFEDHVQKGYYDLFFKGLFSKIAYHSNKECRKLNADFRSFQLPNDITEERAKLIKETVEKYFKKNPNPTYEDCIALKKRKQFNELKIIFRKNSGVTTQRNYSLPELKKNIESVAQTIHNTLQNYSWHRKNMRKLQNGDSSVLQRNNFAQFNKQLRKRLIMMLQDYIRVKYNPDLHFNHSYLDQLGFKQCAGCK